MTRNEPFIRPIGEADIAAGLRLSGAEGWSQTEEDWRLLLEQSPQGCFAMEESGRLIATATAVPYRERFGWVGMMLVDRDHRRRGHGARMLDRAVAFLEARGLRAALDATPAGKILYDRRGFLDLFEIERRAGTAPGGRRPPPSCAPLDARGLGELLPLDRESFGDDRAELLGRLIERKGAIGFVSRSGGAVDGFLLGRPGTRFFHLGPWVSASPEAAGGLLDSALAALAGRAVGVDVPAPNARARLLAGAAGLSTARALIRMAKPPAEGGAQGLDAAREAPPGGRPDRIYGLAGLELG
jgi:GNAT superfamily N-acetyltransferase